MRLLHAETYELKFFPSKDDRPIYAILSHTWENEEVISQDMQGDLTHAKRKQGFQKIEGCCRQAQEDGYEWIWVDTCCIDKSSSAELSEAINSMFKWYHESAVCYAYLADVPALPDDALDKGSRFGRVDFSRCQPRWFTRGWTLQELLAPKHLEFYASDWSKIGTKAVLADEISQRTGIDSECIRGAPLGRYLVSTRMSWVATRETTREEDMAYCLLGMFDVNMPLLYGEGTRAFLRLQEEIFRQQEAYSLLTWRTWKSPQGDDWDPGARTPIAVLATTPSEFEAPYVQVLDSSHTVVERRELYPNTTQLKVPDRQDAWPPPLMSIDHQSQRPHPPPNVTSRGIQATLYTMPLPTCVQNGWKQDVLLAWTYCVTLPSRGLVCILLQRQPGDGIPVVSRIFPHAVVAMEAQFRSRFTPEPLFLLNQFVSQNFSVDVVNPFAQSCWPSPKIRSIALESLDYPIKVVDIFPWRPLEERPLHSQTAGVQLESHLIWSHFMYRREVNLICVGVYEETGNRRLIPADFTIMIWLSEDSARILCHVYKESSLQDLGFGGVVRGELMMPGPIKDQLLPAKGQEGYLGDYDSFELGEYKIEVKAKKDPTTTPLEGDYLVASVAISVVKSVQTAKKKKDDYWRWHSRRGKPTVPTRER